MADVLTRDLGPKKQELLEHALWQGLETGTTTRAQLATFALQDAWLIKEIHRLDGLMIAKAPDHKSADVLIKKLQSKQGAFETIVAFGKAVGLGEADFETITPIAGCAALTMQFYYHLVRSSFAETAACIGVSETIFMEICARVEAPLRENYGLSEDAIRFFSFHEDLEAAERVTERYLASLITSDEEKKAVTQTVDLCLDFEKMFYDAVVRGGIHSEEKK